MARTPDELARLDARIRALDPWFHDVDLGPGLRTKRGPIADEPPDHPRPTWDLLRPHLPSFDGVSVLDVGCNAGFYSFEARRRGAARVLGIDTQRREIKQARLAAEILASDVEFRRASVYALTAADPGPFDVVLALGLLYHCRHPVLALERLHEVTRKTLVLESAVFAGDDDAPRAVRIGGLDRVAARAYFLENEADATEAVFNWFLPTPQALELLLRGVGFRVERRAALTPERSVFVCARSGEEGAGPRHRARLAVSGISPGVRPGAQIRARVRAWNVGSATWNASVGRETEPGAVLLGVHLLDAAGNVLAWDFRRFRLGMPRDVGPLDAVDLEAVFQAPERPGRYVLEFDLVREFEGWFEEGGGSPWTAPLEVTAP